MLPIMREWEIKAAADGRLHRRADPDKEWISTELSPALKIEVHRKTLPLAEFIEKLGRNEVDGNAALLPGDALLRIGDALATALLGAEPLPPGNGWIRLVPEAGRSRFSDDPAHDALIRGIPWPILARRRDDGSLAFLAREQPGRRWIVTLAHGRQTAQVRFPSRPRILIAAPIVIGEKDTEQRSHLEELFESLPAAYQEGDEPNTDLARVVRKWEQFHRALTKDGFWPEVVYFYGHGENRNGNTVLLFERAEDEHAERVPVARLRDALRAVPDRRPTLFFANCCQGEADATAGLGVAIGDRVEALLTNRGRIIVEDARRIGTSLMQRIVSEKLPPHLALTEFYDRDLSSIGTADEGGRWAVPVLYANYRSWVPRSLERLARENAENLPFYQSLVPERVGRSTMSETVRTGAEALLRAETAALAAVFWRSAADQGLEEFATRLQDDLREAFPATMFSHVTVEMQSEAMPSPDDPRQRGAFILKGMTQALNDVALGEAGRISLVSPEAALKRRIPGRNPASSIVFVTYRSLGAQHAWLLRDLLEIWRSVLRNIGGETRARLLLAFPLQAAPHPPWTPLTPPQDGTPSVHLIDLTPEFGAVEEHEVVAHLNTFSAMYKFHMSEEQQLVAGDVMRESNGAAYAAVVRALRELLDRSQAD